MSVLRLGNCLLNVSITRLLKHSFPFKLNREQRLRPASMVGWSDVQPSIRTETDLGCLWLPWLSSLCWFPSLRIRFGLTRFLCANKVKCGDSRWEFTANRVGYMVYRVCMRVFPLLLFQDSPLGPTPANFVKHFCLKPLISYTFDLYVLSGPPGNPNPIGKLILLLKAG